MRLFFRQAVTATSSRGFLKPAPTSPKRDAPTPSRPKSTLALNSATIVLPETQGIYRPPKQEVAQPSEDAVAPDTVSVPNAYELPKSKTASKIADSDPFSNAHLPKLNVNRFRNTVDNPLLPFSYQRKVKLNRITQYMQLISPVSSQEDQEQSQNDDVSKKMSKIYLYLIQCSCYYWNLYFIFCFLD